MGMPKQRLRRRSKKSATALLRLHTTTPRQSMTIPKQQRNETMTTPKHRSCCVFSMTNRHAITTPSLQSQCPHFLRPQLKPNAPQQQCKQLQHRKKQPPSDCVYVQLIGKRGT